MTDIALAELADRRGCACKIAPERLDEILDPVGEFRHLGDVGAFSVNSDRLVGSVDLGTPVVDIPSDWGRVVAAHSVSDIYAAGCNPVFALGILGWPDQVPVEPARLALTSAHDLLRTAGVVIGGGHSFSSHHPLLGFAVIGVDIGSPMSPAGFAPGSLLCLTKPLGTGAITVAPKFGVVPTAQELAACVASMAALNASASRAARDLGLTGCTDVSGFGLLGACAEVAFASRVSIDVWASDVPLLPGVDRLLAAGVMPARAEETWRWLARRDILDQTPPQTQAIRLCVPETSGGLLLGVPPEDLDGLRERDPSVAVVGEIGQGPARVAVASSRSG